MPQLPRGYLQCHYCGRKSTQKWAVYIRSWKCNYCEAFNYLDENGQITDPPVASAAKQSSPQYGRYARATQSPDLSPQGNNIFCKQCLTNQHFVRQNLADYLPDPSDPDYDKYERNIAKYKKDLESRYPQVCANCAPGVNERLKQTKFAANADNLRRGLAKKKPLLQTPDLRSWDWKRVLVFVAGLSWWASMTGQAIWHLLGILPVAEEQMRIRNTSWYGQFTCATAGLMSRELQLSCLEAMVPSIQQLLYLGFACCWWNNKLSAKLYTQERRLRGIGGYMLVQLLSLTIRAAALFALQHQEWLPEGIPTSGIHGAMLVFLIFITLISMTAVKLTELPKPNLKDIRPVKVDASTLRPAHQAYASPAASKTTSFAASFPISALSKTPQSAAPALQETQMSHYEEQDDAMEWTPTGPSQYTQFNHQPPPEYRRPDGPNPFRGTLPPAPQPPAHKIRNPKPFLPASQEKKNNFMNSIRGEIRAKTGSPTSDDEDDTYSGFGSAKKPQKVGFVLGPGNMRDHQAENQASGLEDLFNTAFTINSAPSTRTREESPKKEEQERGFVMDGETVRENVMVVRAIIGISAVLVLLFALSIGMGLVNPKAAIGSLLYEKETIEEVHEVVEDFVQDYIGT